jgi:hypothetical protein
MNVEYIRLSYIGTNECPNRFEIIEICLMNIRIFEKEEESEKQAGAELCQAQVKLC